MLRLTALYSGAPGLAERFKLSAAEGAVLLGLAGAAPDPAWSDADLRRALADTQPDVLVGRAWAYGLAAAGEPGIEQILAMLAVDMDRTLRLLGCDAARALDRTFIRYPSEWHDAG